MRRLVWLVLTLSAVSACGTADAGQSGALLEPDRTPADTTIVRTGQSPGPSATTHLATTPAPAEMVADGDVVVDDALPPGAWTGARTSNEGRQLLVFFVGAANYEPGQPCSTRYVATADETDAEVRVAFRGESPPAADTTMACALVGYPRSVTIDLAQPFGNRSLVALGQPRTVFDGSTLAEPRWLPDGWEPGTESPGLGDFGTSTSWMRSWVPHPQPPGEDSCSLGESGLALLEGTTDAVSRSTSPSEQTVTGSHDINGTVATSSVQANRNITRLSWTVNDRSYLLSSAPACDGDQPPSLEIMVQFARSLHTPSQLEVFAESTCVDVPIGVPTQCPIGTHCGVTMFGTNVNGQWWRSDEGADIADYIPPAWGTYTAPPTEVSVVVADGPDPTLTASLNGHSVTYRPVSESEVDWCA